MATPVLKGAVVQQDLVIEETGDEEIERCEETDMTIPNDDVSRCDPSLGKQVLELLAGKELEGLFIH